MFTPRLTNRGRISTPTSKDRITGDGKRRSNLFTPRNKPDSSILTWSRSQNVSDVGSRSLAYNVPEHELVEFGASVPVLVTEALRLANGRASVQLAPNGWAWLVYDSKLVIWHYKPHVKVSQCFELELVSSSQPYNANLITVYSLKQSAVPACVAVSPDGVLRYWFSIAMASSFTELTVTDILGQRVTHLVTLQSGSCVIGTASSTLVMITVTQGQSRVSWNVLKPAQGMLSGIGRRMSSIFFGQTPSQPSAELRKLLVGEMVGADTQALYVLCGSYLQKWLLQGDNAKMLYQCNLELIFIEEISNAVWKADPKALTQLKTWLLDIQLSRDGINVLGAAVNKSVSLELHCAVGTISTENEEQPPQQFMPFSVISHYSVFDEDILKCLPSYRLLVPNGSSSCFYVYDSDTILCVSANHPELPPEAVDFPNLGSGYCDGLPLFFSSEGCLVTIQETKESNTSGVIGVSWTPSLSTLETSLAVTVNQERINELSQSDSELAKLKAAFLASIQDPLTKTCAQLIVDELFPPGMPAPSEPGSVLDVLVVGLSQEMIDDFPASDPRWAESLPPGVATSSVSLILVHQLDDKLKAHVLYLHFLKNVNLWTRLSAIHVRDGAVMETRMLLCEHAEKLEATKVLHEMHTEHTAVVDAVIEVVLRQRNSVAPHAAGLTSTDVFYREVSKVHEILDALVCHEEALLASEPSPNEIFSLISTVNSIIVGMLSAAIKYRQTAASEYQVVNTNNRIGGLEFIPWTASSVVHSVIRKQHAVIVQKALSNISSVHNKGILFQQLLELTDIMLDGYRAQLDSIKWHQQKMSDAETNRYREILRKYEQDRSLLIKPFMKCGEYERAASLAEKYCDFATLVELCEQFDNQERLQRYMDQFQQNGFSDFVFKWYLEAGKRGKLMTSNLSAHPLLAKFLESTENQYMSWLHDIHCNDYHQAHKTLLALAQQEQQFASKKKTLLSLSKLTALAADEKTDDLLSNLEVISDEQNLLMHQEQLPPELIQKLGMDLNLMRVLSVKELIQMYISDYNVCASEYDFKKALDLLLYTDKDDPDRHTMTEEIWCQAILKDNWQRSPSGTNPVDSCRDTVFYHTLELLMAEDSAQMKELFPNADRILSCELLGDIRHQDEFKYLIRATIEYISRQCQHQ